MEDKLRILYWEYIRKVHELKQDNLQEAFLYLIRNYLEQFNEFFEIYNKNKGFKEVYVYVDDKYKYCRIILFAETNKKIVKYSVKNLKEAKRPIIFTKNHVVIQKPLNVANFSIIQGIVDYHEITEAIQYTELRTQR